MLSREALLFSPTRDGIPSSDDAFSAQDLVAAQDALEAEARDTIPFAFNECTYEMGYIKQPLYACLTCLNHRAVCAACSISCHGEHHLVELFNRRHFRCDCGTEAMGAGSVCGVTNRKDAPRNTENRYDKNFKGKFCICGKDYDPHTETDSMYQCLVCEDWLHHACLIGSHVDSADSLLATDDFDPVVCDACVRADRNGVRTKLLDRYAGVEGSGVMLLDMQTKAIIGRAVFDDDDDENEGQDDGKIKMNEEGGLSEAKTDVSSAATGEGRDPTDQDRPAKRARLDEGTPKAGSSSSSSAPHAVVAGEAASDLPAKTCKATVRPTASEVTPLKRLELDGGKLNVFFEEGWRMRWCQCEECSPLFDDFPFFLEEEEAYEPPDDPDAHKSTHELGMVALSRMPREQAIEGAIAFQGLSERLKNYLRPYSESGATVTKELIDDFFAKEREALAEQMQQNR
ncbi:BQ2448_2783 [Microbotryum intermedium]|uniref:BQ2448_2783 protein n=1 Tax=Microbotryum intermedium TaxID=269621 RepID=A0A238FDE2_9BASI|nr:BQ2448_2783 [Microbotryum intermedium]